MKKITKRLVSLTLAAVAAGATLGFTACSGKDMSGTLVIEAARLGYGLDWLDAMAADWSQMTGNQTKIVKKVGAKGNDAISEEIASLASDKDIFIYRTADYATNVYKGQVQHGGENYDCVYLDLTDTYKKALSGESGATIESKVYESYTSALQINGKYYAVPWIDGTLGIMRNVSLWEKLGLTNDDIPLTTDELFETCEKIKTAAAAKKEYQKVAPFLYSLEDEYYTSFIPVWFAQYEGTEGIEKFKKGLDPEGYTSNKIFTYPGQEKMFEVVEELLDPANGYQHTNSSSLNFTDMQGQFLKDQAVFCVNGAWIEIEMGSGYSSARIDYIKAPVISALAEKLSFYDETDKEGNDGKLSELVAYVDATASGYEGKPAFATEEDVDTVRDARNFSYITLGLTHVMVGSAYSKKTEMIRSFIEYMYSDRGMNVYYKATQGARLPATMSANGSYSEDVEVSDFKRSVNEISRNEILVYSTTAKLYSIGGVNTKFLNGITGYIGSLANGTTTASAILLANQQYVERNWSVISSKIR